MNILLKVQLTNIHPAIGEEEDAECIFHSSVLIMVEELNIMIKLIRRVPLVVQRLPTLPEHLSSLHL